MEERGGGEAREAKHERRGPGELLAVPAARDNRRRQARLRAAFGNPLELQIDVVGRLETILRILGDAAFHHAGGVIGATSEIAAGSSRRIEPISEAWLEPVKAFLPVAIS